VFEVFASVAVLHLPNSVFLHPKALHVLRLMQHIENYIKDDEDNTSPSYGVRICLCP
jgi:hypothetical protein